MVALSNDLSPGGFMFSAFRKDVPEAPERTGKNSSAADPVLPGNGKERRRIMP